MSCPSQRDEIPDSLVPSNEVIAAFFGNKCENLSILARSLCKLNYSSLEFIALTAAPQSPPRAARLPSTPLPTSAARRKAPVCLRPL